MQRSLAEDGVEPIASDVLMMSREATLSTCEEAHLAVQVAEQDMSLGSQIDTLCSQQHIDLHDSCGTAISIVC